MVTLILFVGLVLTVGYAVFLVFRPFLAGLAWASVLAIAIQPLFRRLRRRLAAGRAALLMTVGMAIAFIAPACFLVVRLASECLKLADRIAAADPAKGLQVMQSAQEFWLGIQNRFPALRGVDAAETLNSGILNISKQLAVVAGGLAQNVIAFAGLVVLVLLALFFLLRDGPWLVAGLRRLSPLDAVTTDRLFEEIRVLTEGSVTATLLIAIVQGILGGVTTAILGLPLPLVWGSAFGFCSLVPVFGTGLAWIPAALWLIVTGQHGKAVAMILVSVLIIGQVDNVIRPALVSGRSRLSFEVSMLSVLGGVIAFGMLGLVLGPVVVVVLTAIVDVYLHSKESESASEP
jgi:predicted PurR-regulated permease PerM